MYRLKTFSEHRRFILAVDKRFCRVLHTIKTKIGERALSTNRDFVIECHKRSAEKQAVSRVHPIFYLNILPQLFQFVKENISLQTLTNRSKIAFGTKKSGVKSDTVDTIRQIPCATM